MSVEVVKNVVEMVFKNDSFEQNAGDTLETLTKLKEALNFDGAVKGLETLSGSIKNTSMDALYTGVYKVQDQFSALNVVATRVLQNITDKVMSVGEELLKNVTIAPLKSGLEEYETQINSVQTILANTNDALIEKGLTTEHDRIEKINSVLDDLNSYADMTIYNFTEMTRNIGTFTAAGVELDTAATAIKGIANLAAMSGSNSQQASTAMYQLSQAIASGSVKLQDWNSVVNAGMGGKLFQNELIDTAKAMGVVDSQFQSLVAGTTTFRESLSSGWISAEVLTNTLEKFTAGSEGYTKSQVKQMRQLWEARGYSEKQINELTGSIKQLDDEQEKNLRTKWADKGFSPEQIDHILSMGTAATDAATKVKTLTQLFETIGEALQSGWTQSWEYIIGDFEQAKMLWTEISDIMNVYIGKSADARNSMLKEWSQAAYSYNEAGQLIKLTYDEAGNIVEDADEKIVKGGKMLREEMGGRELVIQSLRNTFQGLFDVALEFGKAWNKNFIGIDNDTISNISITGEKLKSLSLALYDYTLAFKNGFERNKAGDAIGILGQLRESFDFFSTSLRHGYDGINKIFSALGNVFKSISLSNFFNIGTFESVITVLSTLTGQIDLFGEAMKKHFGNDSDSKNRQNLIYFFNSLVDFAETKIFTKLDLFVFGLDALGKVIEHIISPFGTFSELLGKVGIRASMFFDAFDTMLNNEDVSKFETFFNGLANNINKFIDVLKSSIDFSGFSKLFDSIINVMTDDKIDLFGAYRNIVSGLVNILKVFISIATPAAAAFADVFGDWITKGAKAISIIALNFKNFTQSLVPSAKTITALQHVFEGIFRVITAVADVVGNLLLASWNSLRKVIGEFLPDSESLSETLTTIGDTLIDFSTKIESLVSGENGMPKLSDLIDKITNKFVSFFGSLKDVNILEKLTNIFTTLGDGIKRALGGTDDMTLLDTLFSKVQSFLTRIHDMLSDESGNLDFVKILEAGGIGVGIKKLIDLFKELKKGTGDFQGFLGVFSEIKDAFTDLAETIGESFKADAIKVMATSILEIAAALFIISMIDPMALTMSIAAIAGIFDLIDTLLLTLKGFSKADAGVLASVAAIIQSLGNSVLMMAGAIAIIGNMGFTSAVQGIVAVVVLMEAMVGVVKQLSAVQGELPKIAGALIGLAIALNLLVRPVKVLGEMDLESLAKGMVAVGLMLGGLVASAVVLSDSVIGSDLKKAGFGMVLMAASIKILASAVTQVANLSWEQLAKGLSVMAVGLIAMVGAASIVSKNHLADDMTAIGGSLIMLGVAMMMLTSAAKGIAGVEWEDLGKMAAVLAGALIALGIASYAINGKNLLMIGGAIFLVATAISQLTVTLNLAKIIGPLCTSISAAFTGISDSLVAFSRHAAAQAFLQFLQDAILLLPRLAVGLAQALIQLVVTLAQGAGQLVGAVVGIGKEVLAGIVSLLPDIAEVIRVAFDQVLQFMITEIPRIFEVITTFFDQLWPFLTAQVPQIMTLVTTIFTELMMFIQTEAPMIIDTIFVILEALLARLVAFAPVLATAGITIILGFIKAITARVGQVASAATKLVVGFINGIASNIGQIINSAFNLIISFINGLSSAISSNSGKLTSAVLNLIKAIVGAITGALGQIISAGAQVVSSFISGITGNAGSVFSAGATLASNAVNAIRNGLGGLYQVGVNAVQGLINGMGSLLSSVISTAKNLVSNAVKSAKDAAKEKSPSRLTYEIGEYFTQGFINGMDALSSDVTKTSKGIAYAAESAFSGALNDEYSPELTPVLDMNSLSSSMKTFDKAIDSISAKYDPQTFVDMGSISSTGEYDYAILREIQTVRNDIRTIKDKPSLSIGEMNVNDRGEILTIVNDFVDTLVRKGLM